MTTDDTMFARFSRTARRCGDQVALEVRGRRVSYAELDELSARLADLLTRRHGHPPGPIGLLALRSVTAYAGYLAILRCGRTVVPLNPTFPAARNAVVARAAGLAGVLADGDAASADLGVPATVVPDPGALPPAHDAAAHGTADDLAYVLFTSGSTGAPKGVPIRHRNVTSYLDHVVPRYEVGVGSRLSQTFDLTFDPSVFDMFVAWSTGATLVVPDRRELLAVPEFVERRGITHWFSVPSVVSLAHRLRRLRPGCMPGLRWSLFAGEQLTLAQAHAWASAAPGSRIGNVYGPTELTVTCTEYRLPVDVREWPVTPNGTVPIGRPYPGLEHLILDDEGRPADEGELVARGPQRFPGYLDPAADAGRFVHFDGTRAVPYDGTGPLTAKNWYRTGDRVVRQGTDLVHLGRLDQQVKVQGYRVELGEVEAVLRDQPGVRDAVVLAVADASGHVDLFAAYTGAGDDPQRLLDRLRERLPGYMVPRSATQLDAFPLNPNGKVDRRALATRISPAGRARSPEGSS
ncbi:amino acid adenylation domain-containing protein [Micromonospora sp. NPDC047074]|uniref:amino acid adenylation domain-containing protein n=1 Tax=Micromonospora sp. NPDC047074 TaxID=3154339 RepID=UPI0033F691A4